MRRVFIFLSFFIALNCNAQDTIRVLFIGNSFTYVENMPDLFRFIADSAGYRVKTQMYAPGGVSVGDVSQGTQAHMNNPIVYENIRSDKWDYVVLQDNQGRFVLDYGQFPSSSLVIEGHKQIRDSVLKNNPCAKMIWFSGWALKNGMPPYGNTGAEMIDRITANYHFLNDSLHQIIAPIGSAWKELILSNPSIDPWSSDETHQSLVGSFLTANVIYATIFRDNPEYSSAKAGLAETTANLLKQIAWQTVKDSFPNINLQNITPDLLWQNNQLIAGNYQQYFWYKDFQWLSTATTNTLNVIQNGHYFLIAENSSGCKLKSISQHIAITSINDIEFHDNLLIYPNPVSSFLNIDFLQSCSIFLYNTEGTLIKSLNNTSDKQHRIDMHSLSKGMYLIKIQTDTESYIRKFVKE
ncbi:MAG: T9SS type A sorting domain-containing protein [Bacteroidetes bacterium]|nr:T9SS type A sorting domain-containing protein [Bacteroidota bacterium]